MEDIHAKQNKRFNEGKKDFPIFEVGQKVWYRRPERSGNKMDTRWIGPGLVLRREGEHSYVLEIKPEVEMSVHVSYLKPYKEDSCLGNPVLYFITVGQL